LHKLSYRRFGFSRGAANESNFAVVIGIWGGQKLANCLKEIGDSGVVAFEVPIWNLKFEQKF
jgi:hypothetical protein